MKRFGFQVIFCLALMFLFGACASPTETATQQPGGPVPGEKVDSTGIEPGAGAGGASANVRW